VEAHASILSANGNGILVLALHHYSFKNRLTADRAKTAILFFFAFTHIKIS
jgi:hypothetical protein